MNNYQQLFIDLKIKLTNEIYEKYSKQINEIARTQKKSVFTILDEIAKIILEYNVKDEVMDISIREKLKLKKQMNKLINDVFKDEYKIEKDTITSNLINAAKDSYYSSCFIYQLGVSYKLKPVKQNILNKIINKKIDGKTYSNRIWNNKNKVAKMLKKEINDFLNGKLSIQTGLERLSFITNGKAEFEKMLEEQKQMEQNSMDSLDDIDTNDIDGDIDE